MFASFQRQAMCVAPSLVARTWHELGTANQPVRLWSDRHTRLSSHLLLVPNARAPNCSCSDFSPSVCPSALDCLMFRITVDSDRHRRSGARLMSAKEFRYRSLSPRLPATGLERIPGLLCFAGTDQPFARARDSLRTRSPRKMSGVTTLCSLLHHASKIVRW